MQPAPLLGRRALITGASRGLGLALAQAFAAAGAHLALSARDAAALEAAGDLARAARQHPEQQVRCYPADLGDASQIEALATACLADFASLDILINNAAIQGQIGPFASADWQTWQQVIQVDFLAPARLCQLVIPVMQGQGYGKIINLSGGGAATPRPDFSAYAAAKAALVRLSETLAAELEADHIDVNCVAPGALNTRMLDEVLAAGAERAPREHARALRQAQEGGTPLEAPLKLILWLASAASDGISGRLISAVWDDWPHLAAHRATLMASDIYTLRRILPADRGNF